MRRVSGHCFSYLSEDDQQQLFNLRLSAPHLIAISDLDIQLVQRLLYYTHTDFWLSDEDKDWHYLLLATLREERKKT